MKIKSNAIITLALVAMLLGTSFPAFTLSQEDRDNIFTNDILGSEQEDYELAAEIVAEVFNSTTDKTGLSAEVMGNMVFVYQDDILVLIFDPILGLRPADGIMPMFIQIIIIQFFVQFTVQTAAKSVLPKLAAYFLLGGVFGWLIGANMPQETTDVEAYNLAFRIYESEIIFKTTVTASELLYQLLTMDAQILRLTEVYFNRIMEVTAASFWSPDGQYDTEAIIQYSGTLEYVLAYVYNYSVCIEQPFYQFRDVRSAWYTQPAFDSMIMSFVSDPNNANNILTPTVKGTYSPAVNSQIYIDACQIVQPSPSANRVYLDTQLGSEYIQTSYTMYVLGILPSQTVTITDDNGFQYVLGFGANDVRGIKDTTGTQALKSGWFTLQTGAIYCGSLFSSVGANTASVTGGLMLIDSGQYAFAYFNGNNYTIVNANGTSYNANEVTLRINFSGDNQRNEPARTQLGYIDNGTPKGLLVGYSALIQAETQIIVQASEAGRTAWNLYSLLNDTGALTELEFLSLGILSPSALVFSKSADLSADGLLMAYIAGLRQIGNALGKIDLTQLMFSAASLNSYMFGTVIYEGREIVSNGVFTLISYSPADIRIDSGQRLFWPESGGLLVVWANNLTSFSEWDGIINPDDVGVQDLNGRFSMDIAQIYVNGSPVASIILKADTMERMGLLNLSDYRPFPIPQPTSKIVTIILIMIVMFALIVVGVVVRGAVGAVIILLTVIIGGLILASVTGYLQEWLGSLLPSWWPFSFGSGVST